MTPLHVDESGTPGGQAVIFLHGSGTSGWMWWRQTAALADFHCLTVDLPGHGRSSGVEWVSLADTAQQVAALIGARTAAGRAHVVGLSLGGHVALALLEARASAIERAVISGVTAAPWPNRWLLEPQLWMMSLYMQRPRLVRRWAAALPLPPEAQAAFHDNLLAMSMEAYRRIAREISAYRAPAVLAQVTTPTLILAGGRESAIITGAVDVLAGLLPKAQGRLAPGRGHGWNVEAPDLFNATVRAWLTGTPLPDTLLPSSRLTKS